MAMQTTKVDASEFERFATLPENADRLFELIGGEIIEVVSNGVSSALGSRMNVLDRRLRRFRSGLDLLPAQMVVI